MTNRQVFTIFPIVSASIIPKAFQISLLHLKKGERKNKEATHCFTFVTTSDKFFQSNYLCGTTFTLLTCNWQSYVFTNVRTSELKLAKNTKPNV